MLVGEQGCDSVVPGVVDIDAGKVVVALRRIQ